MKKNSEEWESLEELVGASGKLKIQLRATSGSAMVRLVTDDNIIDFQSAPGVFSTTSTSFVDIFNFQLKKKKKWKFPLQLASIDINLGAFKAHFECQKK